MTTKFPAKNTTLIFEGSCQFSNIYKSLLCPLLMSAGIFGFLENVFFCFVVFHNKKLHKRSMILLVSLSISDILISLCIPITEFIYTFHYPRWPFENSFTYFYNGVWLFSIVLPFMTVTAFTTERYLAIAKRNLYEKLFSNLYTIGTMVLLLWIYSFTWVGIMVANFITIETRYQYVWNVPGTLYLIFMGLHIGAPLVIIPILNYLILRHVKKSRREATVTTNSRVHHKYDVRLANTVIYVVVCLYIVWIPVLVLEYFYNIDHLECTVKKIGTVSVWLISCNCCINPVIYSLRNSEVKKYFRSLWTKFCGNRRISTNHSQ